MLKIFGYCAVIAFIGIAALGHILLLRALLHNTDHMSGTGARLPKGRMKRA